MAEDVVSRGGIQYVCSFSGCCKSFKKQSRLREHFRTHTGERPYVCSEPGCTKSYSRAAHLTRHQQVSHPGSDELESLQTYTCSYEGCGQLFTYPHNLKKHIKRIHTNTQYQCTFSGCNKTFRKHHQLKAHQFEHTSVNPYTCSVEDCGKTFTVLSKLRRHQKTHQGFTCDVDGCSFKAMKWTLMRKHKAVDHVQTHQCSRCEKVFKQKSMLKSHLAVHEDMRLAFECPRDGCGRAYFNERNLSAHIRAYHDGQRFPCPEQGCGRTLCTKSKLQQHMKLHDPNKPLPKRRKKKPMAAVISGYKPKRKTRCGDPLKLLDSDDDKISLDIGKQKEISPELSATITSNSTVVPLELESSENEGVASGDREDVTMVAYADCLISETEQDGKPSCDAGQKGIEIQDTDNSSLMSNNTLTSVNTEQASFSSKEYAIRNISLQKFDFVSTCLDNNTIILKRPSAVGDLTKDNFSMLTKRDYSVSSACSATSLPIGQILENPKIIDTS